MVRRRGAAAQAIAVPPPAAPAPDDGYGGLTASEVLADLPSLDAEQLLIVKALEEAHERRAVILDRIADLLVVRTAARHLAAAQGGASAPDPAGVAPRSAPPRPSAGSTAATQVPPLPDKAVSPELVDQMGSLLAKSAARRTSEAARPLPPLDGPAVASVPPAKGKAKRNGRRQPPNGVIVPTGGHRLNTARAARFLIVLTILALLAGGATLYLERSHRSDTALIIQPAPVSLANLLVKNVPAGYVQQPDTAAGTGPADLAQAAQQDGAAGAQADLSRAGFVRGYQRLWTTAGRQQGVDVFIYQFRTPTGASTYAPQAVATAKATAPPTPSGFAVAGIPGAVGLAGNHDNPHRAEVLFTQGAYWVKVAASGPSANTVAQQVAAAEYSLIPA